MAIRLKISHLQNEKIIFGESYVSFRLADMYKVKFGRYYRDFSTYLNDELSSGSMLIGINALPIPKIGLLGCLSNFLDGESIADLSHRGTLLSDLYQSSQLVDEQIHRQKFNALRASQWLTSQRFQSSESIPEYSNTFG